MGILVSMWRHNEEEHKKDAFFLDTIQLQFIKKGRVILGRGELIVNDTVKTDDKLSSYYKWGADGKRGYCFSYDPTDNQRSWKGYAKSCKAERVFYFKDAYKKSF